jgi:hypothetical protein
METVTIIRIVAGILFLLFYFLPSIIGRYRRNAGAIFLINLLTGWSGIGWFVALIWALTNDSVPVVAAQPQVAVQPPNLMQPVPTLFCSGCGKCSPPKAKFCQECGAVISEAKRVAVPPQVVVQPPIQAAQGNWLTRNFGIVALIVVVLIIAFAIMNHTSQTDTSNQEAAQPSVPATSGDSQLSNDSEGYHVSNEIIRPYEISKNPYKMKGHSGILDTVYVPIIMGNGTRVSQFAYPGGGLKFEKMIDEHTATYSVLVGEEGSVIPDGEIAVILPDSNPPDSRRPWRVFVEGPMEGVNGFGAAIQVVTVRFEGYD